MNRPIIIFLILVSLLWILAVAHGQIPPDGIPAPKFKHHIASTIGIKPATQMLVLYTNKPIRFLAISRGPSPYDDMVNVDTILIGTVTLSNTVTWQIEQIGHTNQFISTNNSPEHYWRMGFIITTNL